ncbi:hypothetical protein Sjap_019922 [Stephania japonica]|uniref:Uncharacterized protein n=1 Tax=Stephania japonica TaxID=461633 RepID=A0AAP0F731_9MAGN
MKLIMRRRSGVRNNDQPPNYHVMPQTPLHVAAGSNDIEVVKFLLECQDEEKIELEAKNMYGETPLHMAAKNGCTETVDLLLKHGAL